MGELLSLIGVSFASALIPLINLEVYLIGLGAVADVSGDLWALSATAAVGQMAGKLVWYYLGANALRWGWVRRKVEKPKAQEKLELWRRRTHDRPVTGGVLVFVSAVTGFPPFAIVSVLAGQLRLNVALFLLVGTVGRTLHFAAYLAGGDSLFSIVKGWF